jgi:hypothetical protein
MLATGPVWGEPPRGFELAAQTPHFLFYSRNGEPIDVHEVERSLWKVQRLLGQELPARPSTTGYGTPQEVAADLGNTRAGVTLGSLRQIHTVRRECPSARDRPPGGRAARRPGPFFTRGSRWR